MRLIAIAVVCATALVALSFGYHKVQAQPLASARGHDTLVADSLEALGHGLGVRFIVIDHQDADLLVHSSC